jgi:CHAT domain-containing protein/tetratricopeptide (TPR) repeat protein
MSWLRALSTACVYALLVGACSGVIDSDPLVEYSTELVVQGDAPRVVTRQLAAGTYLIEIRERDIDLRAKVDAGNVHTELADAYLRHGLHRTVVSLDAPRTLRITLNSVDQRTWRGGAALRILRWPRTPAGDPPDQRLSGFTSLGEASAQVARGTHEAWQASIAPFRAAAEHFRAANDVRSQAEAEYARGYVEFNLLMDFPAAQRSAEAAQAHFRAVDDELGAARTALLLTLAEVNRVDELPGAQQLARFDVIRKRLRKAREYFDAHDLTTDAIDSLNLEAIPDSLLGNYENQARLYDEVRARATARGDKFYEAMAAQNLAYVASRSGEIARAAAMYEKALPLIERDRNPDLYATITANLGHCLIALGEFDRALVLQTQALEVFMARGDEGQTARSLSALGAIQFRTGNLDRAYESLRSALPLFERAGDSIGQSSALRLTGNVAAELGLHDLALEYLRKAERLTTNREIVERTRVLIAGELRVLGDLRGAERMLADVLLTTNDQTRADALAERARLRQRQRRPAEALGDLREADSIYARLQLDFNRIDTSSALALAQLDHGDVAAAAASADTAVGIETRIRVKAANPEMRARFLSASYAPYEARIEVDLAAGGPGDVDASWKAFRTADAIRARSLVDRLAHAGHPAELPRDMEADRLREKLTALQLELEKRGRRGDSGDSQILAVRRGIDETRARLESRLVSERGVNTASGLVIAESRDAVQSSLPADTAVLAYFVGDARSHAWLLTRRQLRHAVLPGRRALQNLVHTFVERQRSGVSSAQDSIFAPVLGNLLDGLSAKRLLVLPDGPLNGMPFAALPLPRGSPHEMLIDRFVLSAGPSLALALRPQAPRAAGPTRVAVISDPVYTSDDRRLASNTLAAANYRGGADSGSLARLPYSAIEARAVVRAFEGTDVIELAGFNATARRVIELPSRDLEVLHFATHAVTRRDAPEQSALFLSEFAADGSPLAIDRLTADDIARSGLRADVVVLSGCATGDGSELRGEGVLGLTYGFLANGSQTVVASLWPVEDALTARFMEEFYAAYRGSGRAADALRAAQLRTRGAADSTVWSSFVVRANGLP